MLTALPAFDDNYIWLLGAASGGAIVVDPGDAAPVLRAQAQGCDVRVILITHHHADHVGGVEALQAALGVPCLAPPDPRIPGRYRAVEDGDSLQPVEGLPPVRVLATPGHTRSHVSYLCGDHLFCGDTLFSLGCGRLFEGSAEQMHNSLQRLSRLPETTRVCCAHEYTAANGRFAQTVDPGNAALSERIAEVAQARAAGRPSLPSTLGSERDCNPFLRVHTAEVRALVEARVGRTLASPVEVFAALRAWKDVFV